MRKRPALIVFARAPLPGRAKTRLIPALGPARAAELYRCFLLDTLDLARRSPADVILAAAEPEHLGLLRAMADEACPGAGLIVQQGADLGERILSALRETLGAGHPCTVVIGSDSPNLPAQRVCEALDLSARRDLVLGPCLDGGYYLVGAHAARPEFFRDIAWGSEAALSDTVARARTAGASIALLEPWYDVDTPADLERLRTDLEACPPAGQTPSCQRTWEYLLRLPEEGGA